MFGKRTIYERLVQNGKAQQLATTGWAFHPIVFFKKGARGSFARAVNIYVRKGEKGTRNNHNGTLWDIAYNS